MGRNDAGITYRDVENLAKIVREEYGHSVTYRLDPDVVKYQGGYSVRYWVVAEAWKPGGAAIDTIRQGEWFRGRSGCATMPEAMYNALIGCHMILQHRKAVAESQSAF